MRMTVTIIKSTISTSEMQCECLLHCYTAIQKDMDDRISPEGYDKHAQSVWLNSSETNV